MNEQALQAARTQSLIAAQNDAQISDKLYKSMIQTKAASAENYQEFVKELQQYHGANYRTYQALALEMDKYLRKRCTEQNTLKQLDEKVLQLTKLVGEKQSNQRASMSAQQLDIEVHQRTYEIQNRQVRFDGFLREIQEYINVLQSEEAKYSGFLQQVQKQLDGMKSFEQKMKKERLLKDDLVRENKQLREEINRLQQRCKEMDSRLRTLYGWVFPEEVEESSESDKIVNQIDNGSVISSVDDLETNKERKEKHSKQKASGQRQKSAATAHTPQQKTQAPKNEDGGFKGNILSNDRTEYKKGKADQPL